MKKAITYINFVQNNGRVEMVQTLSDERIAIEVLMRVWDESREKLDAADVTVEKAEQIREELRAINIVRGLLLREYWDD